jgi:thioredoxin reductase
MGERKASTRAGLATARLRLARVIRIVFTVIAALLAIGALLIALRHNINEGNVLVKAVTHVDDFVDGPFGRKNGIFNFGGKNAVAKEALVNWGIAAIVYLVIGRALGRVVRP